jgi:hypothetical protein
MATRKLDFNVDKSNYIKILNNKLWVLKIIYNIEKVQYDFEGEMNFFVPLCVHENECDWKRYETKILQKFQPYACYKWLNIVVFPHFLRYQVLYL